MGKTILLKVEQEKIMPSFELKAKQVFAKPHKNFLPHKSVSENVVHLCPPFINFRRSDGKKIKII